MYIFIIIYSIANSLSGLYDKKWLKELSILYIIINMNNNNNNNIKPKSQFCMACSESVYGCNWERHITSKKHKKNEKKHMCIYCKKTFSCMCLVCYLKGTCYDCHDHDHKRQ
jgi:hypothetical protein